jgi:hypothetical protein
VPLSCASHKYQSGRGHVRSSSHGRMFDRNLIASCLSPAWSMWSVDNYVSRVFLFMYDHMPTLVRSQNHRRLSEQFPLPDPK